MKKSIISAIFLGISVLTSSQTMAAYADMASIYMKGEPGDWVSGALGAEEVLWTHGIEGLFDSSSNFDQGASIFFDNGDFWRFEFVAPTYDPDTNTNNGNRLEVGLYDNATRFPFNSPTRPGMSISGNGRGNNTLGGWFDVLDVDYENLGIVSTLAVDFRQFGESEDQTGSSLYGSLRFNSDLPITYLTSPVPVPAAVWLFGSGLVFMTSVARRRH